MSEKLIVSVLGILADGPATSQDVADELGISVKTASATISDLKEMGSIIEIGNVGRFKLCRVP